MKGSLNIDRIAFIGRTYDEYMKIFDLDESVLRLGKVLDCPAGASSFTAEANKKGVDVTASDIFYDLAADVLMEKGKKDIQHVFEKFNEASHLYVWKYYKDKKEVMLRRKKALELFSGDFPEGRAKGRYIQAGLPHLPFADGEFTLVLSGHFLFLYHDRLDPGFHRACLKELVRVCSGEVRIFPLSGLDTRPYPYMDDVLSYLRYEGVKTEIVNVPFEFQKGANQMLKLRHIEKGFKVRLKEKRGVS
jgi:hypothetical protein